jgi:hypothetical protein
VRSPRLWGTRRANWRTTISTPSPRSRVESTAVGIEEDETTHEWSYLCSGWIGAGFIPATAIISCCSPVTENRLRAAFQLQVELRHTRDNPPEPRPHRQYSPGLRYNRRVET